MERPNRIKTKTKTIILEILEVLLTVGSWLIVLALSSRYLVGAWYG